MTSTAARQKRAGEAASPSRSQARATLREMLALATARYAASDAADELHVTTVAAPAAPVDAMLRAFPGMASFLWSPAGGRASAGLGEAVAVEPRVDDVGAAFRRFRCHGSLARPRMFGGLAFAKDAASNPPWAAFGDGGFVLPKWTYETAQHEGHRAGAATLTLAVGSGFDADEALAEFDAIWDSLEKPLGVLPRVLTGRRIDNVDRESWCGQVEAIVREINQGTCQKVVAARHCTVQLSGAGSDTALDILDRLKERFSGCTTFAIWRGDAVFVGATPELLVSKGGAEVRSEALAGSTLRGDEARLLASSKERDEHQLVVDAIVDGLSPYCVKLHAAGSPAIRELHNLIHMQTPIDGQLREDVHVLTLVRALHPTPAVGGVPRNAAVEWILTHEATPRGWYSAPIGWVDAEGDGEFAVALRSGVIQGDLAWVYAGAGIMSDSDPEAEYDETELKMQALLGALDGEVSF